jgi:hypothetical protein
MQSKRMGVALALAAVVVAAVLFVVLREEDSTPDPATTPPAAQEEGADQPPQEAEAEAEAEPQEPEVPTIVLRDGEPVGGVEELSFRRGERIEFAVRSNTAEEVHLHGYDVVRNVEAGGRVRFDVEAEFEGVFEVELHPSHVAIAEVAVGP